MDGPRAGSSGRVRKMNGQGPAVLIMARAPRAGEVRRALEPLQIAGEMVASAVQRALAQPTA